MNEIALIWLEFLLCVGLIGVAGQRLIKYGDAIAELTGLSRSWIGLMLVATVTSLPELVTGLSAVTLASGCRCLAWSWPASCTGPTRL